MPPSDLATVSQFLVMPHYTLVLNRPYSTLTGLVAREQSLRLSHTHPLFRDDNQQFYGILEEAVLGTVYDATIKPFQRREYGCGSYLALIAEHAGRYKWIEIMHTHTYPLFRDDNEKFYGILEYAVRRTVYETTIKPFQRLADGCGSYLVREHATTLSPSQHKIRGTARCAPASWLWLFRPTSYCSCIPWRCAELLSTCLAESDARSMQGRNHDHLPASGRD